MSAITLPRTTFPIYEHKVRSKLDDLISRVFSAPFAKVFSSPIASPGAAAIPWYLSGGIAAANCIAAYQAKGAASLAASYINLAKPGTYDCHAISVPTTPTWTSGLGWSGIGKVLDTDIVFGTGIATYSVFVRFSSVSTGCLFGTEDGYPNSFWIAPCTYALPLYSNIAYGSHSVINGGTHSISAKKGYQNGIYDAAVSAGQTTTALNFYLLCLNQGGTPVQGKNGDTQCVSIYNRELTAAENLALHNAAMAL